MLRALLSDTLRNWTLSEILEATKWTDQVHVAGAGQALNEAGLVEITESSSRTVALGLEGVNAAKNGLLEERIWNWLLQSKESERNMQGLFSAGFERHEAGPGVGLLKTLGVKVESGSFVWQDQEEISATIENRTSFINSLAETAQDADTLDASLIDHFQNRKGLIEIENNITRNWTLTKAGTQYNVEDLEEVEQIGEITPELLQGESWRDAEFKPFDVNAPAPIPAGGRPHPMQALIERIRSVFLEMGFSEIEGDYVQSAGGIWMLYSSLNLTLQEPCKIHSI